MSIAMSDNSSFLLRNVSFTMRLRFTPARACSTCTRILATWRLSRFSSPVSSRPLGFFFRLTGFPDRRIIPLESCILVQNGLTGVHDLFLVGDLFVMRLSGIGGTQKQDAVACGVRHDDVLAHVGFLLATVEKRLFSRVSWSLATTLGAINDQSPEFGERATHGRQAVTISFGHDA